MVPKLDEFTTAYIECALWSTLDENNASGGVPLDKNYSIKDLSSGTLEKMKEDCRVFQDKHTNLIEDNLEQAGHDFWLTRNRHGAGFWDGGWDEPGTSCPNMVGKVLTSSSHDFGEFDLYVGDNGLIYH